MRRNPIPYILLMLAIAIIAVIDLYGQGTTAVSRRCPGASPSPARATVNVERDGDVVITPCTGRTVSLPAGATFGGTTLTPGSVLFAGSSGEIAQNNAQLFWNDATRQLRIFGPSTQNASLLNLRSDSTFGGYILLEGAYASGVPAGNMIQVNASRGTLASPSALQADDGIFRIRFRPYGDGHGSTGESSIAVRAAENLSGTARGAYLSLNFTTVGTETTPETARIYSQQAIFNSASQVGWSATTTPSALDTGFARQSAGLVRVTNGSTGLGRLMIGSQTPASAAAACAQGTIVWDADYVYVCIATDTWKRAAIATW